MADPTQNPVPTAINSIPTASHREGWQGCLNLTYDKEQGKTRLKRAYSQAPLKVQRPFYPEGDSICHSVILHTAGGMVGGDLLSQNIHLHPHAHALITTAAASKVYCSNGFTAKQCVSIEVETGAILEWLPQETIIFNGALYRQDIRIELAPGASMLLWDLTRFGRTARGERFIEGEWRSRLEVWQQGHPLVVDRQWFPASEATFNSPHALAGYPVVGTLLWLGMPKAAPILQQIRSLWEQHLPLVENGAIGVTQTQGNGVLCRYRGASMTEVRNAFIEVWQLLRYSCLERSVIKPRVWQL